MEYIKDLANYSHIEAPINGGKKVCIPIQDTIYKTETLT